MTPWKEEPRLLRGPNPMRVFLAVLALLLSLAPGGALAHAALVSSDPVEGSVLPQAPSRLVLTFNEPVGPLALRWIGPDGDVTEVPSAAIASANGVLTVTPSKSLTRGSHALSWRVASADGHPVGGTLGFAIGAATGRIAGGAAPTALPAAVARWALTLALVMGAGGAVFIAFIAGGAETSATRRLARASAILTLPLAGLAIGLHGADMLGSPPRSLLQASPWLAAASAAFAWTGGLSMLAGLLASLAIAEGSRPRQRLLAAACWSIAAASFAMSGHATTPVRSIAVAVHAAALIFWVGALPGLSLLPRGKASVAVLHRFSRIAVPAVLLLIASGSVLILSEADRLAVLTGTAWGRLLLVKLVFVIAMLGLALLNRQRLTPRIAAGGSWLPLRRSIKAELVLGIVVLALASGFRLTGTPASEAPPVPAPMLHLHGIQAMANVTFSSGRTGSNALTVDVTEGDFGPLAPKEIEATLSLPAAGIETLRLPLDQRQKGEWASGPFSLPIAGSWDLTLRLLIDDFTSVSLSTAVQIAR